MERRTPWAATGRSLALVLLAVPSLLLTVAAVVGLVLAPLGVGLALLRAVLPAVHGLARAARGLATSALGHPVPLVALRAQDPSPLLDPAVWGLGADGRLREVDVAALSRSAGEPFRQGWRWLVDADAWRLLGWVGFAATGGLLLSALVVLLVPVAVAAVVLALVLPAAAGTPWPWALALVALAVLAAWTWWRGGDALGRARAAADAALLSPGRQALLEQRVRDLAASRSRSVDDAAAELRRIERDLHDGAQARLVSLGLTLGLVAELMADDPDQARALLAEARGTTAAVLRDLRELVQGIHPPVLADRGLSGAVEALALDLAVPVTLTDRLPGRPPPAVESAAYFAVAESLANVVKHADASRAWVRLDAAGPVLRVEVGDDGVGGADPARGSGLQGVRARVAAFDGTMGVDSPPGGPTVIHLEVPCAWSSPKTSPSSATV
ncbi:histidine kinase [Cellulomonas sp. KH9]|uniref:histidine kinase n=1 Tax=Cellulomonas sp. KH9 TaxID=1855324 RepID=UPI0008EA0588|nr:histidine kinase [Cellulomonas sp. KH9]SFJ74345.1 Signal transduction histidine kinase [Cellulomonas sp. KH9]